MKVLQVLPELNVGGVERGVIDLSRAMLRKGEEMVVISSGGELVKELQKIGVVHYTLPVHRKTLLSLRLVPKIARIIRTEQIDVVHARSRVPAWLAWLACRQTQTPFVTTCHGYYAPHVLSRVMGWGKLVIVISRIIGRHMIDDFGVSPDRIRLIPRGVDLPQFGFSPKPLDFKGRPFRIINIGRLTPIKGQVEFLKAVHVLRKQLQHVEVWLVGSEKKGKKKYTRLIEQTIEQLGLGSCVKLLGTRRDITDLLKEADLLVLSTLVPEAFGRVVIEAGAVGTPVLATQVGGILDILEDGKNGRFCEPGNVESMAQGMLEILTGPEKTKEMAAALRKKVEENFSLDAMTAQTFSVYQEAKHRKKILIIKLGAMGDLVLAVPSFRMIRQRYPKADLSLLVDKRWASIASTLPYLDEIIPVERERLSRFSYLLKLAKRFRKDGFEISIDLQNSKWTHLAAFFANIPARYGFKRGKFGFLLNRPDTSHSTLERPVKNQFRILSKLGVREPDEKLELWTQPEAEERVREWFKSGDAAGVERRIGLVMGSSSKWKTKRWPKESFRELAAKLTEDGKTQIVLIGSEAERTELLDESWLEVPGVLDLVGKTTLIELISLIKALDGLVCGDTAPLHIATAFQIPTVALFGPTDARRHHQPSEQCTVLVRHLACQPCYQGECRNPEKLACLNHIGVEEVYDCVQKQTGVHAAR